MARQVLPIVGAVIGAFYGNPQLGYAIGSLVGNAVDPLVVKGPKIGDAGVQTSAEGVYRPVVYGVGAVMGNIIERGNRKITKHRTQQGKGGPVTEEERVSWTFAIRISEGPVGAILRIWEDEKPVYDVRPETKIYDETVQFSEMTRIYLGGEDQLPDPDLEAYKGIGNVNAYRGTCYIVFPNYDLTDRRESIPNYRFEVATGAEITDYGSVMASGESSLNLNAISFSVDGDTWSDPVTSPIGTIYLAALLDDRFLAYNNAEAAYTDDFGDTWVDVDTSSFTGIGVQRAAVREDKIIIPAFLDGVYRSIDNGETFTHIPAPGVRPNYVAWVSEGVAIGIGQVDDVSWITNDFGATWSTGPVHDLDLGSGGAAGTGNSAMFGGANGGLAAVSYAESGNPEMLLVQIPDTEGLFVSALACELVNGFDELWVAGLSDGQLFHSTDRVYWIPCNDDLGARVNQITVRGGRFFAGGGLSGTGIIKYSDDAINWTNATQPLVYSVLSVVSRGVTVSTAVGQPVSLSSIVAAIQQRAGLVETDYDVTQLTDMVYGIVLAGDYTCADAIKSVMPLYTFDAAEYDDSTGYRIRFIKRGAPVQYTLSEADFVSVPDKTVRLDSLERPRVLHMSYQNPTIGYAPAKASPSRNSPDVKVVGELSAQVPVSFVDVDEAWQRADVLLKQSWVEIGGEEDFSVSYANLDLIPTDVIGVALRGQVRRVRVVQSQTADGVMQLKLIADRQSAYTSTITGMPVPEPTPPPPSVVGPTIHWPLDIPALNDNNDRLLTYGAATGQTEAWYGALIQRSRNGGVTWEDTATFRVNSIMGVLVNTVSDASPHYTDTTNEIVVELYLPDPIESISQQEFLSEGGSLALSWENSDGRQWEVLQYRDAQQNSDGSWTLSTLLRGRLNTETVQHPPGSLFVLLDTVQSYDNTTGDIGTDISYRAISLGNSPEGATVYTEEYTGQSQREWPVASLTLTSPSAGSVVATAIPRNRFGTEDNPIKSVNWAGYRWTAADGTNTITRDTIDQTTTFDTTGWSSPVTVTVAQMNRITGPGPTVSEQIA